MVGGDVRARLVVVCGVIGNLTDRDVEALIGRGTQLCARGGQVIWTRYRRAPDLVPSICDWFARHGFDLQWLSDPGVAQAVGVHRFRGRPQPLEPGAAMFTFVGSDVLRERLDADGS